MTKIYLVTGSTGECDDRHDWNVCAYKDEDKAIKHAVHLNELLGKLKFSPEVKLFTWEDMVACMEAIRIDANGDSKCWISYPGAEYGVEEIELNEIEAGE